MKKEEVKWHHKILVIGVILLIVLLVVVSGSESNMCEIEGCGDLAYCKAFCGNENLKEELNATELPV